MTRNKFLPANFSKSYSLHPLRSSAAKRLGNFETSSRSVGTLLIGYCNVNVNLRNILLLNEPVDTVVVRPDSNVINAN